MGQEGLAKNEELGPLLEGLEDESTMADIILSSEDGRRFKVSLSGAEM
jgi:hypothetical protein